jgi:hypothetical protein
VFFEDLGGVPRGPGEEGGQQCTFCGNLIGVLGCGVA